MLPVIALGLSTLLPASLSALRGPTPQESAPQDSAPPEGPVWRSIEEATVEGPRRAARLESCVDVCLGSPLIRTASSLCRRSIRPSQARLDA